MGIEKKFHCPKCNYRQEVQPAVVTIVKVFNYTGPIQTAQNVKTNIKYN